jgi:uncharacterized protein DUF4333
MRWLVWPAVAIAFAACGDETIDSGKLEQDIKGDVEREGLVLDDVSCPSPEVQEGDTFECTVTVKGEERKLEVRQRANQAVGYDLTPLLEFTSGGDAGGDEASVRFVIDALNADATALCDYATDRFRRKLGGDDCGKRAIESYDRPMRDYVVVVSGNTATAKGDGRTVTLRRQRDGSWLITAVR